MAYPSAPLAVALAALALTVTSSGATAEPQGKRVPLRVELHVDDAEVGMNDAVRLKVLIVSEQRSVLVYSFLAVGRGVSLSVKDKAGKETSPLVPLSAPPPGPPPVSEKVFVALGGGGNIYGFQESIPVTGLVSRPGTYMLSARAISPVPKLLAISDEVWVQEDGPYYSKPVKIVVR